MPKCKNPECNFSKRGKYFKNKICPKCNTEQEIMKKEEKETLDETDFFSETEIIDNQYKTIEFEESEDYDIPQNNTINDFSQIEEKEETNLNEKVKMDSDMWESLTTIAYGGLEEALKRKNPEFYNSDIAKNLNKINAQMSAKILTEKEVSPTLVLGISTLAYLFGGFLFKSEKEETEQ